LKPVVRGAWCVEPAYRPFLEGSTYHVPRKT
jgi:hypothetical protein